MITFSYTVKASYSSNHSKVLEAVVNGLTVHYDVIVNRDLICRTTDEDEALKAYELH